MSSALSSERITSLPATVDSETLGKLLADFSKGSDSITDPEVADWVRGLATNSHVGDLLGPVFSLSPFLLWCARSEPAFLKSVFDFGSDTALIGVVGMSRRTSVKA